MCEFAGIQFGCEFTQANYLPIFRKIEAMIDQMNQAMELVGVPARIQHADDIMFFLNPPFDERATQDTLDIIRDNPTVQGWRAQFNADLVSMITGPGDLCGIAYVNSHESAASYTCFDNYIMTLLLGFNFGAARNREDSGREQPYGHAFRYLKVLRTVMAADCDGGCPIVPVYSANGFFSVRVPLFSLSAMLHMTMLVCCERMPQWLPAGVMILYQQPHHQLQHPLQCPLQPR